MAGRQGKREAAEARLAELEAIARDLKAEQADIEALVTTWKGWIATPPQVGDADAGSVPAEAQARQVLKKVLVGAIELTPAPALLWKTGDLYNDEAARDGWIFQGYSRFEKVLVGGLGHGIYNALPNYATPEDFLADPAHQPPIAGGPKMLVVLPCDPPRWTARRKHPTRWIGFSGRVTRRPRR